MHNKFLAFVKRESFSGLLLLFSAVIGLMLANSSYNLFYQHILYQQHLAKIINDGLMVLFFLLIGCEIKREVKQGELNSRRKIILPLTAAFFGMLIPAIFYIAFNQQAPYLLKGWAISSATDIAFALGILNLLGKQVPVSLKALLTAIAIFDDVGAIIIIALFYTHTLHWIYLSASLCLFLLMNVLNYYFRIYKLAVYLLGGILLWFFIIKSGVHPTIAGVLLAMVLPDQYLDKIEHFLHPVTAYFILPLFAIANTGIIINIHHISALGLGSGLSLGIICGLILGKQLGIFSSIFLAVKAGFAPLPRQCHYGLIYGLSLLCGIGFTMSLFIAELAFQDAVLINTIRAAVLAGSLLSGIAGYAVLRFFLRR